MPKLDRNQNNNGLDTDDTDALFGDGSESGPEWAMAAGMTALSVGAGTLATMGFPHVACIAACTAASSGFYYTQSVYGSPDTTRQPSYLWPLHDAIAAASPSTGSLVPQWFLRPRTAYERSASADVIGLCSSATLAAGNAIALAAARAARRPTGVFTQLVLAGALSTASFGYRTAIRAAVLESEGAGPARGSGGKRGQATSEAGGRR